MAEITVTATGAHTFQVTVKEGGSVSSHAVTTDPAMVGRLAAGTSAESLVEASFRFLLDRERKESILSSFDLSVISRYFPEYGSEIAEYL